MQKNSVAKLPLESIVKDSNFFFETLDLEYQQKNFIYGHNPIKKFESLAEIDKYLIKNPKVFEMKDSGLAGYIGFDGKLEFTLYETIVKEGCLINDLHNVEHSYDHGLEDNFEIINPDSKEYINAVMKAQEYIKEGDIYQVNLCHKFLATTNIESPDKDFALGFYEKIRYLNPSPYAGFMETSKYFLLSSSPESFLKIEKTVENNFKITSSPIKGTAELNSGEELLLCDKEKAEHVMIVDLIRNDLSMLCKTNTVKVDKLLEAHKFANLYHLISEVSGILDESKAYTNSFLSLDKIFKATFPGGSISGAPKIRALEIIKELESSLRGPYTGTMGYFRFQDGGEFNILIRTIVIDKETGEVSFHAGSGITASSNAEKELQETYLKTEKIREVFQNI